MMSFRSSSFVQFLWCCFLLLVGDVVAFTTTTTTLQPLSSSRETTKINDNNNNNLQLFMAPKYNVETERWEATTPEDLEGGYDVFETIVRNGPLPFIQRVINGDSYEQGVLKMMANYGFERKEAQGNLDASLENQADWLYQKMAEKNGAPKKDYGKSPTQKAYYLAATWTCIVFWFFGSIAIDTINGKYS